jgi:hypothetical protein
MASALGQLLADPAKRAAFGAAGAERARRRYSWRRVAAQTEAVYVRLAARGGPAARGRPAALVTGERSLAAGAS